MQNFTLQTHIGTDGILHLELPVAVKNTDLQVTITCEPISPLTKSSQKPSIWEALQSFRAKANLEELDIDTRIFDSDRKRQQERDVEL